MSTEWILDVLTDLKAFAEHNGMEATADALDDARLVALTECASLVGGKAETTRAHEGKAGDNTYLVAGRDHA